MAADTVITVTLPRLRLRRSALGVNYHRYGANRLSL
jgi:hypothetical protein